MKNPDPCYDHREETGRKRREQLDPILEALPSYTGGHSGKRCPYCAYLQGYKDALKEVNEFIKGKIKKPTRSI